jgi:hypothetical protein
MLRSDKSDVYVLLPIVGSLVWHQHSIADRYVLYVLSAGAGIMDIRTYACA